MGVDAQQTPLSLESRGVPRAELLAAIEGALPKNAEVVLVQDACFSGKTAAGDLAPGMAPLKSVSAALGASVTVLAGARSNEYAGPLPDGSRPAFSYLVLGALRGWGDLDGDRSLSATEAITFAERALVRTTTGRSQTPELAGPDVALGRAGREEAPDLGALSRASTRPRSGAASGEVVVELGGGETDFAALAEQAAAADAAAADAEVRLVEVQTALEAERRKRLDAAAADVRSAAKRDFDAINSIVADPTEPGRDVLVAWLDRYRSATISIDGFKEVVTIPELERVERALALLDGEAIEGSLSDERGLEWVRIQGGYFTMGNDKGDPNEGPAHRVFVPSFELMKTEVTVRQYRACVDAGACMRVRLSPRRDRNVA